MTDMRNDNLEAATKHLRLTRLASLRQSAVAHDRLEEAYAAIGDDYNARNCAAQADALWAQVIGLTAECSSEEGGSNNGD